MIDTAESQAESIVSSSLEEVGYELGETPIDMFPDASEALAASPVAFQIASQEGTNPASVATQIADEADTTGTYFTEVSATGPYVNLYVGGEWYQEVLELASDEKYGAGIVDSKNVSVEHTSVNPTGPLHIGRVRNSIIGDCISNVLEFAGHEVSRDYYVNDAGLQVAMLVWGYHEFDESELPEPETDADDSDLVRYYRKAAEVLDKDTLKEIQQGSLQNPEKCSENAVIEILQGLEQGDEETEKMVREVVEKMLNSQVDSLNNLGIQFDEFVFESKFLDSEDLDNVLDELKELDESFVENGAWKVDLEDYGIDKDFVFERSNGTTLYGTRDILYHIEKTQEYDEAVLILGEDQETQIKSVYAIVDLLGYDADSLTVVHHAFVQTPEGGMSTRQGEGDFLYEVMSRANEKAREATQENNVKNEEKVVDAITVGAIRYNIISKKRKQLTTFDVDRAVSVKSQAGPSIQYAYARMNGIIEGSEVEPEMNVNALMEDSAYNLLEELSKFPSRLDETIDEMDPHSLAVYAKELKEAFNDFYRDCPVQNASTTELAAARLGLVMATSNVMETVLDIIGVPVVEEM